MAILREFDLDIPYVEDKEYINSLVKANNWEYTQATRFDYQQTWKEKRMTFREQVRCVCALYARCLGKYTTPNCRKLLVDCVTVPKDQVVRDYLGVYTIYVPFNIDDYFTASDYEKKKITLNTLKIGIDLIVKDQQWEKELFDRAYDEVIKLDYVNKWTWKKPKFNSARTYAAEVSCEHEIDQFNVDIIIKQRDGSVLKKQRIITERPDEFAFAYHFGKLKWLSNSEVSLINKRENECWCVRV